MVDDDENVLDYEEESEDEEQGDASVSKKKRKQEAEVWNVSGGWSVDPHKANKHISTRKPNLTKMPFPENSNAFDFLMQFLPVDYLKTEFIPNINERGSASSG